MSYTNTYYPDYEKMYASNQDRGGPRFLSLSSEVCFQKRIFQGSMILMQLPPTGLKEVENFLRPSVVLWLQRFRCSAKLECRVASPHRDINAGPIQI